MHNHLEIEESVQKALVSLEHAEQMESLCIDEDNHFSQKGLAYFNIFKYKQAKELFSSLLLKTSNPVTQAYAITGLYQFDKGVINRLAQYPKIKTDEAVNIKINCSVFVGMRLADIIHDDLHQQLLYGQNLLHDQ